MAEVPFDDRDGLIWLDGKQIQWRQAKVHVLTHALHYASSVFEGVRVYGGKIFKLREHSERLRKSAEILGFEIPWSAQAIDDACSEIIKANGIVDGYIRPFAWRGSEMMGVSAQRNTIHLSVAAWSWPSYFSPKAKMKGIRLKTSEWHRPSPQTAPVFSKAAGLYMICTLSKHAAEKDGFDDALMLDWQGNVAEATGANIFMVFGDRRLHTPKPVCFLDGITRRTIIELARNRSIEVIERVIKPTELEEATEVFLTGTATEVTPVGTIDDLALNPSDITFSLMDDYEKHVGKTST